MTCDPADLARTYHAAFPFRRPWSAEEFAKLLDQPGMILCGDARSFALGRVVLDEAELLTVATHPDLQRQGRARDCMSAFEIQAVSNGAFQIFLEVSDDNHAAKVLYIKAGFHESGRRPHYYTLPDGRKVDAVMMYKSLKARTNTAQTAQN